MNEPAFPSGSKESSLGNHYPINAGLTLRDYFAARAMQGFAASDSDTVWHSGVTGMAQSSYAWADAMLARKEQTMTITHISARELELEKEAAELRKNLNDWLYANGPNGWINELRSDLDAERLFSKQAMASVDEIAAQRDAARAELAAIQNQEPAAWMGVKDGMTHLTSSWSIAESYADLYTIELVAKEKTE